MSHLLRLRSFTAKRLFVQQASEQVVRSVRSSTWNNSLPRAPSVHRQSNRWRPSAARTTAYDNLSLHAEEIAQMRAQMYHRPEMGAGPNAAGNTEGSFGAAGIGSRTGFGVDAARNAAHDARHRLLVSYHDLEHALERRGLKSVRVVLGAVAAIVAAIGLAWPRIKQWGAVEGAEVAAASLEDEQLQAKAVAMVHDVLADPGTGEHAERILKQAVLRLLDDKSFTSSAIHWATHVLSEAILQDNFVHQGTEYVRAVCSHDDSLEATNILLSDAVKTVAADEVVQAVVASGIWSGLRSTAFGRGRTRLPAKPVEPEPPKVNSSSATTKDANITNASADTSSSEKRTGQSRTDRIPTNQDKNGLNDEAIGR